MCRWALQASERLPFESAPFHQRPTVREYSNLQELTATKRNIGNRHVAFRCKLDRNRCPRIRRFSQVPCEQHRK